MTSVCKLYAHVSSSWLIHTSLSELAAFSKLDLDPADGLCFDVSQHTPRVVCTGMGAQAWDIEDQGNDEYRTAFMPNLR